jgi:hypothetical protein
MSIATAIAIIVSRWIFSKMYHWQNLITTESEELQVKILLQKKQGCVGADRNIQWQESAILESIGASVC